MKTIHQYPSSEFGSVTQRRLPQSVVAFQSEKAVRTADQNVERASDSETERELALRLARKYNLLATTVIEQKPVYLLSVPDVSVVDNSKKELEKLKLILKNQNDAATALANAANAHMTNSKDSLLSRGQYRTLIKFSTVSDELKSIFLNNIDDSFAMLNPLENNRTNLSAEERGIIFDESGSPAKKKAAEKDDSSEDGSTTT